MATYALIGIGLFFISIALMSFRKTSSRLFSCILIIGLSAVSAWSLETPPKNQLLIAATQIGTLLFVTITGSALFRTTLTIILNKLSVPSIRWGTVATLSLGTLAYGLYSYEVAEDAANSEDLKAVERIAWRPPLHALTDSHILTDEGEAVEVQAPNEPRSLREMTAMEHEVLSELNFSFSLIRHNAADDGSNCHGWVFTGGKYWLSPKSVEKILEQNGYHPVTVAQPGDIVVYSNDQGIQHTAIVRYVGIDVPIVEGKWAWMGVFLHPVDQSCYGTNYTFFRSDRENHLLVGLGGKPHRNSVIPPLADHEFLNRRQ